MAGWAVVADKEQEGAGKRSSRGIFLTTLVAFFLVEIGDKTQIATSLLAAQFHNITLVTIGTTVGKMLANVRPSSSVRWSRRSFRSNTCRSLRHLSLRQSGSGSCSLPLLPPRARKVADELGTGPIAAFAEHLSPGIRGPDNYSTPVSRHAKPLPVLAFNRDGSTA
jgi:hypothetical protein